MRTIPRADGRYTNVTPEKTNITKRTAKQVSFFDFKGLMAPVFTCFNDDEENTLRLDDIDKYAQWLKAHNINGVLVNSLSGEGPALGLEERKMNCEAWWKAALKYKFILMVQVGGAPLPDVLELATHAEDLGVHAVLCMPELFYKPQTIDQLIGYLRIVAKRCNSRPFFYYHIPRFTGVHFKMQQVCERAEDIIPNFFGLQYSDLNLSDGEACLQPKRVVLLGEGRMLASGMLLGFQSAQMTFFNVQPEVGWEIFNAMENDEHTLAMNKQRQLNKLVESLTGPQANESFVPAMKAWFNREALGPGGPGFQVGPARRFF